MVKPSKKGLSAVQSFRGAGSELTASPLLEALWLGSEAATQAASSESELGAPKLGALGDEAVVAISQSRNKSGTMAEIQRAQNNIRKVNNL